MTGTIEITVKVYLTTDIDGNSEECRQVVNDVIEGELNLLVDNVELISFTTEDEDE